MLLCYTLCELKLLCIHVSQNNWYSFFIVPLPLVQPAGMDTCATGIRLWPASAVKKNNTVSGRVQ